MHPCAPAPALTAAAVVLALTGACSAHADPEPVPPGPAQVDPPQAGSPCAEDFDGALTELPRQPDTPSNAKVLLRCADGSWGSFTDPYPSSPRWLTTGPELILHGQGRRNPEILGGTWSGMPQTDAAQCRAETVDVIRAGETSAPDTHAADPGQPVTLDVSDHLFTVALSGYCLWQRD